MRTKSSLSTFDPVEVMRALEALRFILELAAIAALAVAGGSASWVPAVLMPLALIVIWGWLIAPKSTRRLPDPARLGVEVTIFIGVGAALAASGRIAAGLALAVVSIAVAGALRAVGSPA